MKSTSEEGQVGKSNLFPEQLPQSKKLTADELFQIEGGEDMDMDEDCYVLHCLIGAECVMLAEW